MKNLKKNQKSKKAKEKLNKYKKSENENLRVTFKQYSFMDTGKSDSIAND